MQDRYVKPAERDWRRPEGEQCVTFVTVFVSGKACRRRKGVHSNAVVDRWLTSASDPDDSGK